MTATSPLVARRSLNTHPQICNVDTFQKEKIKVCERVSSGLIRVQRKKAKATDTLSRSSTSTTLRRGHGDWFRDGCAQRLTERASSCYLGRRGQLSCPSLGGGVCQRQCRSWLFRDRELVAATAQSRLVFAVVFVMLSNI